MRVDRGIIEVLDAYKKGKINMSKIIVTQSVLWATAILISSSESESAWLFLAVLATLALGTLKKGIESLGDQ